MASISARYSLMETGTLAWRSSRKKFTNMVSPQPHVPLPR
jgi:hypothetical protein